MNPIRALIGVVDHPAEALEAVAQRPRLWWLPAVLLALSMAGLIAVSQPYQLKIANERSAKMIERIKNRKDKVLTRMRERSQKLPERLGQLPGLCLASSLGLAALGDGSRSPMRTARTAARCKLMEDRLRSKWEGRERSTPRIRM